MAVVELVPRRYAAQKVWMEHWIARPVVGLDIDGTLGLYHEHFLRFADQYLGRPMPLEYFGPEPLYQAMKVSKATYRQVKLAYRQGGLKRSMPVREGARELSRALRRAGAEVWICTTRPYLRLDNIDPDTREWLRRNGIQYDGVLFGERKYGDLARLVKPERVIAVIDDLPEQVRAARAAGLVAYLIDRPYNELEEGLRFVDLSFAREVLVEQIRGWINDRRKQYGG